jgi:hypothetical protein
MVERSTSTEPSGERSAEVVDRGAVVAKVVAAGDIACVPGKPVTAGECRMEETAALAESLDPDVVLPLGDLQYERGEAANFAASYDATWGRLKEKTRPVVGNHEYAGGRAHGYYSYFGEAAHPPDGWYSFDLGPWHVVVLNSVCAAVGGCGPGSRQHEWLRADLEATTSSCILAAWHHPRWSSGLHHSEDDYEPFWQLLAARGADLVLSGHDHHYERFAPDDGIVQVIVGTGGRSLYPAALPEVGSRTADSGGFGVLELVLHEGGYVGSFHPIAGNDYRDAFWSDC